MSVCLGCGVTFNCAMLGDMPGRCWCMDLPPVVTVPGLDASCLCPGCLKLRIAAQQEQERQEPARL